MEFTDANFIAAAAVVAALVAAIIASVTLISAKESKVSEFRQDWIDDQREDLAKVVATSIAYFNVDAAKERPKIMQEFFEAKLRIALREKPVNPEWSAVIHAVDTLAKIILGGKCNIWKIREAEKIIIAGSRPVLKNHWETAKKGELFYRGFKSVFLIVSGLLFAAVVWLAVAQPLSRYSDDSGSITVKITRSR